MATAKKTATKRVSVAASEIHNVAETVQETSGEFDQLRAEIETLRDELAALKARLFHPSER